MKNGIALLALALAVLSCKKEKEEIAWSRTYGQGKAYSVSSTADSGMVACGELNGHPYLLKLSQDRSTLIDYSSNREGHFTSAWSDNSGIIAAGSSEGKMLLSRIGADGIKIWDTLLTAGFTVERTSLLNNGGGTFTAVGSVEPDSTAYSGTGLFFVRFDTVSRVLQLKEYPDQDFISSGDAASDISGNIYLALTIRSTGTKPKACAGKYSGDFNSLWQTELYNNPDIASSCTGVMTSGTDSVYITGRTEVQKAEGTLDYSFIAALGRTGLAGKKKFLENSNSGSDLVTDGNGQIIVLNKNCFFVNVIKPASGYSADKLRIFSACNAYQTDAFGSGVDITNDGNIVVAGSVGNEFYLAIRSAQQ